MSYLNFEKSQLINLEYSLSKEILRSNRAGSYASTTIVGCNTRKYHGLLICPMENLDGDRHILLSSLDDTIVQHNSEFNLGIHKYEGDNYVPKGHKYLRDFEADPVPKLVYRVGGVVIEKERLLVENQQQFLIRYKILEADHSTKIRFKPFLAFRSIHKLSKANTYANTKVKFIANGIKSKLYDGFPYLHLQFSKKAEYVHSPDWYYNIEYLEEQRRGYDFKEDLFVPGYFEMNVKKGEVIIFSASTTSVNPDTLKRKFIAEIEKRIPRDNFKNCLINSAQQFVMKRDRKTEIIAGFHWFGSWGRDTFIALPGLTLAIGDVKTCKAVIDTMVSKLANGLFPNTESSDEAAYNSVDAPLWFFWALQQYSRHINSYAPVWKTYNKALSSILNAYRDGTLFNIKMHKNGLIYAGEKGHALTWMDAVVNGIPVTPRIGAPVEINALWYNALMFSLDLAKKANDEKFVKKWGKLPALVKESFIEQFWDADRGYLADFINSDSKDWSVRPNQVIATSLEFSPVDDEMITSILNVVERDLLTPRGLRTLSPKNKNYLGIYEGNQEQRDGAYHQGTVWPWLLEHFCEGYINVYKDCGLHKVQKIIKGFEPAMNEHGIGTISEIYDGDPPHKPRGAISQAWSVAALLRIIEKVENFTTAK
ncbi:MAG: glycogen debranching enzyme family protein [Bacteroidales bacterium]|nr:MAG: glycogen debranching enzyme family protein [Bacteroidales bacterium]